MLNQDYIVLIPKKNCPERVSKPISITHSFAKIVSKILANLLVPELEPLHMLFKRAHADGLLGKLIPKYDAFRVSFYADDAALFISPSASDLQTTNCILQIFAEASGLNTNLAKTQYYPIQCGDVDQSFITSTGQAVSTFPTIYLGGLETKFPNISGERTSCQGSIDGNANTLSHSVQNA
jgi:hypothetical protein